MDYLLSDTLILFSYGAKTFEDWTLGERISDLRAIEVGDVLFSSSLMYRTLYLVRVTKKDARCQICQAVYCDPRNVMATCNPGGLVATRRDFDPQREFELHGAMLTHDKHWRAVKNK